MDPLTSFFTLANVYDPQKAAAIQEQGAERETNRLARQVQQTQLRDWLRDKEVQKMVSAGMVAPGAVMPGSTDQPVNQLAPPPQGAPPAAAANLLAPKPPAVQGGVGAGVAMPTSPMAAEQPAAPAAPATPAPQPGMLQRQLAVYQQMKADGKIEDYEYGKLVTEAVTASNAKAAADLEQFSKLAEMVKKAGGPAKFGALVSSGMFDGIAPPETLAKLKQIDYSKMKEEPDFTEYELPSGGRLVSGRDADGKPYTHVMPAEKSLSAEQLTAKSLEEKLGRKPTATEIKTEMDAGKSKTPEQLRAVFTDTKLPPGARDKAWNDFKLGATPAQFQAIAVDKTLPAEYRAFAQSVLDAEDKRKAKQTQVSVNIRNPGGDAAESFSKWSPEDKQFWFETKQKTGETPNFGWGKAAAQSRAQFSREYAQWARGQGLTPAEAGAGKEEFKADAGSLKFVTKQLDASGAFIKTIDNNIDQLERHVTSMSKTLNLDRNRLLNMGTRDFNRKLVGNANINIYDMLVAAISTENAKLQAGGAGSVAQVAEGARAEMAKIHDNNLPVSEMIKLMKATREEGGNRIKALHDQRGDIQKRMRGGGGAGQPEARISQAARRIASDMRNNWSDNARQTQVYNNLKKQGYSDKEIGTAFAQAKGGR